MATKASTVAKKFNEENYSVVKVSLKKDLVAEFKEECKKRGVAQAEVIRQAIEDFLDKRPDMM